MATGQVHPGNVKRLAFPGHASFPWKECGVPARLDPQAIRRRPKKAYPGKHARVNMTAANLLMDLIAATQAGKIV
ncbi:hypothetical protein SBA1_1340013 [Candidatus Sulfotelmatobacter kueseliae]|uniref:Uncharacterized protein n=1 Tax=Candidatus Sulfotelmatobacter kueseliae TaxID=2042962 RepID=A0A2U3K5H5_9BACT|nr:hypothetical protein SBA1_1340013 [Candidatus Sulfotelmatobacter kueseliae]